MTTLIDHYSEMSSSPAGRDFAKLNLLSYGNTAKGGQATPKAGKPRQSFNLGYIFKWQHQTEE